MHINPRSLISFGTLADTKDPVLHAALVLLFACIPSLCSAEDFLVRQDGSTATQEMKDADPVALKTAYWEIHLYSSAGREWGLETAPTYEGVMNQVKRGQNIDLLWARVAGINIESFDNHMHPGPPTAVLKNAKTKHKEIADLAMKGAREINDVTKRYEEAVDAWNTFTGNWDKVKVKPGAMANVGMVFKEYVSNYKDVFQKMVKLKNYTNQFGDASGMLDDFLELDGTLAVLESTEQRLSAAFNSVEKTPQILNGGRFQYHVALEGGRRAETEIELGPAECSYKTALYSATSPVPHIKRGKFKWSNLYQADVNYDDQVDIYLRDSISYEDYDQGDFAERDPKPVKLDDHLKIPVPPDAAKNLANLINTHIPHDSQ